MEVTMTAICDAANISKDGKLNILGTFDRIRAKAFPVVHPKMCFAFQLRGEPEDSGRRSHLQVTVLDQDGQRLWGGDAKFEIGSIAPGDVSHMSQVIEIVNARFARPGRYRVRLQVGDRPPSDSVFLLVKTEEQDAQGG